VYIPLSIAKPNWISRRRLTPKIFALRQHAFTNDPVAFVAHSRNDPDPFEYGNTAVIAA
jgi:hypothetical protein